MITTSQTGDECDATLRILLVEDHPDLRRAFKMMLEFDGHEIVTASDGFAALELLELQTPDVAFVDIGLPQMDGCELARRIRGESRNDPMYLAALTGYNGEEAIAKTRAAGFDQHLIKPIGMETIRQLLRQLAQRRTPPASPTDPSSMNDSFAA